MKKKMIELGIQLFHFIFWQIIIVAIAVVLLFNTESLSAFRYVGF